jgi:anionic cell wall polymer biosynthesis LytR-Cps2A-Psr (LCP) family protein
MDGATALMLARIRQYSTFSRADNQNIVLCALRKKILTPALVTHIPGFLDTFKKYVQTDFTPEQLSQLACLAPQVESKNITFTSFPQKLFKIARMYDPSVKKEVFVLDTDFSSLRTYVTQFNQGTWPPPDNLPDSPTVGAATEEYTCP